MAQNNAINNRTSELTIDPGSAGDSFVQFDINATNEVRIGVDDDDGDSFKVSQGGALGTNDQFIITADGERTLPENPCFYAYLATNDDNVTGTNTVYTLGTNVAFTSVFDVGSNLTLSPMTFTAPITGRYLLTLNCSVTDATSALVIEGYRIVTSNRNFAVSDTFEPAITNFGLNICMVADMDAADTATYNIQMFGEASNILDVEGSATEGLTAVSGCLVS